MKPTLYIGLIFCDSSWQVFDNNSKDINQFAVHNSKLYCATKQGVCLLDSLGNYRNFYQGYSHRNISSLTTLNDTIFITASNELFYSVDQGENFTRIENAWGKQFIPTDSVYYLITEHEFKISRDLGISWESHSDSIEHYLVQRINNLSIATNAYYLATKHGLFRSLTDTICWTKYGHGYIGPDYTIHRVEAINRTVL